VGADYAPLGRLKLVPERLRAGLYLDLGHQIADTTLVVSTGRSGSTWIAEIINHRNEYRLVFEPFRADRVRKARLFRRGEYVDPLDQEHPLSTAADALLTGRVRSWWTDAHNHRRISRARIVKEVRITNLLPWIRARHPALRIVYAIRDPVAVARSWLELGWGDDLDEVLAQERLLGQFAHLETPIEEIARHGDPLERHVLRWCLENAIPLKSHAELDIHLVVYERLRAEPVLEVERLFHYLGRDASGSEASVRRLSATARFPRVRSVTFSDQHRSRAREIVALFDLAELAPVAE
jgi:sulfotransferase family protein